MINHLNAQLNPICHLLALLGAHHIFHVRGLRVNAMLTICLRQYEKFDNLKYQYSRQKLLTNKTNSYAYLYMPVSIFFLDPLCSEKRKIS